MRRKSSSHKAPAEWVVKVIRRATRKQYSTEDKIRIVLDGLRGEDSIAKLCRREGIAQSMYYVWSKEFLEAGKRRLAGDTSRAATSDEVKDLRRDAVALKEVVAGHNLSLLMRQIIGAGTPKEAVTARYRAIFVFLAAQGAYLVAMLAPKRRLGGILAISTIFPYGG